MLHLKSFLLKIAIVVFVGLIVGFIAFKSPQEDNRFVTYIVNPKIQNLALYWENDKQEKLHSFKNLNKYLATKNEELLFAMNAGMYKKDYSPQGLYIENGKKLHPIETLSGNGNFYLQPNGVFYLSENKIPNIIETSSFKSSKNIHFATQSGPMLVINGEIHPAFNNGSKNLHIRNGVGILPDNTILFAMSKKEINFYDFAEYFKSLGCKNALYLDGFVSRTYLPEKDWTHQDGTFGVLIGVTKKK
jgi:uncharacterized protein YigE (DUF2233 family)